MTHSLPKQTGESVRGFANRGLLLVVAAPAEARAVRAGVGVTPPENKSESWSVEPLAPGVDLIETGVGKAQAAAGTAWALDPEHHSGVLSLGLAGALPTANLHGPAPIGSAVLATRSVLADEGVRTPDGFLDIGEVGFPPGSPDGGFGPDGMAGDPGWMTTLEGICDRSGIIATVSACSGTDEAAREVAERTAAIAENMEGAAVAAALSRLPRVGRSAPIRFAEIRVISNTTGDRDRQVWGLPEALERLGTLAADAVRVLQHAGQP